MNDEQAPLSGFSWRGGSVRHTVGIWIWSKIFTKSIENGEKIGVMLMDTQGTFDNTSTIRDNITIFALSTMLSSVQIYNLFNNIQQDDLENLQLFTEYGQLAKERGQGKPFQNILFLIRDWNFPYELPYGITGGNELLSDVLNENDAGKNSEIINVRKHIKQSFEKVEAFLMPYPGTIVTRSNQFDGKLADIDSEFKTSLKELTSYLFAPQNVTIKSINGNKIKAGDMISYFENYVNVFKSNQLPSATSLLKVYILSIT